MAALVNPSGIVSRRSMVRPAARLATTERMLAPRAEGVLAGAQAAGVTENADADAEEQRVGDHAGVA